METTIDAPSSSAHVCEVCGKPAEMRFLEHAGESARRVWRTFCPQHGEGYLLSLPESEFQRTVTPEFQYR